MTIEFVDLHRQYLKMQPQIDQAIKDVISSSAFIMGEQVAELEKKLAQFVGMEHAVACASGTDALFLALLAYDIRSGDEIITTPFTFISTSEVIALLKAKPVFVDIDEQTFNIDYRKIASKITPRTKGIIAVDLFGQCADYDEINAIGKEYNLFVIEDAAQSLGAEYKGRRACSLADVSCTSFFPAKPLGCYGDGGMVFTNDAGKGEMMRSLRAHGKGTTKYDHILIGMNARLDTLQAAILLVKLRHFSQEITLRNKVADFYQETITGHVKKPTILEHNLSAFAQYSIRSKNRDQLQKHLSDQGIPSAIHYPKPLHLQTAFSYLGYKGGDFPVAEQVAAEIISLPMHPYLNSEELNFVCNVINNFF